MNTTHILLLVAATWRMASLICNEEGPFDIFGANRRAFRRLHKRSAFFRATHLNSGINCEWCVSVWLAFPFLAMYTLYPQATIWYATALTLSTGTIFTKFVIQTLEALKANREVATEEAQARMKIFSSADAPIEHYEEVERIAGLEQETRSYELYVSQLESEAQDDMARIAELEEALSRARSQLLMAAGATRGHASETFHQWADEAYYTVHPDEAEAERLHAIAELDEYDGLVVS